MAEIIEIGLNDNKPKNLTVSDNNEKGTIKLSGLPPASPSLKKSVNFGPGADLLMNPSRKSNPSSPKSDLGLSELNNITLDDIPNGPPPAIKTPTRSSLFAAATNSVNSGSKGIESIKLNVSEVKSDAPKPSILKPTTEKTDKTWDGYGKFNNIVWH